MDHARAGFGHGFEGRKDAGDFEFRRQCFCAALVGVGHADDLDEGQAAERPRVIGAYRTGAH